jgi:hypothetical protein
MRPIPRKATDGLNAGTWQLDHILAVTFRWWDIVLVGKSPIAGGSAPSAPDPPE